MTVILSTDHFGRCRIPAVETDVERVVTSELGHQARHRMVTLEDHVTCECGWQSVSGDLRICLDQFNEHVRQSRLLVVS